MTSPADRANYIHPTAVVADDVEIGHGNQIGPYAVILGPGRIGNDNWVGPHSSLGSPAESRRHRHGSPSASGPGRGFAIGDRNFLREYTSIHQGTERVTRLGSDCYLMTSSHVGHDSVIGDGCTLASQVVIAGHCTIGRDVTLGLGSVVHQFCVIGDGAMIGMQAAVNTDVLPFSMVTGPQARAVGANLRGLERWGVPAELTGAMAEWLRAGGRAERPSTGSEEVDQAFQDYLATPRRRSIRHEGQEP